MPARVVEQLAEERVEIREIRVFAEKLGVEMREQVFELLQKEVVI